MAVAEVVKAEQAIPGVGCPFGDEPARERAACDLRVHRDELRFA
jgi:hypothetical protein